MALSTPSYAISPLCNPIPKAITCSSFLPNGLHSSSCSPFASNGAERLPLSSWQRRGPVGHHWRRSVSVKALFGLGVPELVVIAGVTALIFGPKKLPEIGKSLGKTVKSFQQAAKEFEAEVKQGGDSTSTESSKTEVLSSTVVPEKEKESTEV